MTEESTHMAGPAPDEDDAADIGGGLVPEEAAEGEAEVAAARQQQDPSPDPPSEG